MLFIKENKNLIFSDICGRLPYTVQVKVIIKKNGTLVEVLHDRMILDSYTLYLMSLDSFTVTPYLFPLSSMTEEQKEEERHLKEESYSFDADGNIFTLQDFYNKYHLDYRGLIPKRLAMDASGLDIY